VAEVRLIIDPPLPGPWNMAVDEALLMDTIDNGNATLRFYQWSEPTLSLGYFQRYADREQHAASRGCTVVRRQSGGGAILHDRELTYSLVLPPGDPLTQHTPRLYEAIHAAFIAALSSVQPTNTAPSALRIRGEAVQTPAPAEDEPFLCFQRQAPGDVVLAPAIAPVAADSSTTLATHHPTWKVLGSAQRRHRGAILQHGSLLVERSPAAPELPGLHDLDDRDIQLQQLIAAVCAELTVRLEIRLVPYQLSGDLQSIATGLTNSKYGSSTWTNRR
jgi:lipoyl(octanoyl) transferase